MPAGDESMSSEGNVGHWNSPGSAAGAGRGCRHQGLVSGHWAGKMGIPKGGRAGRDCQPGLTCACCGSVVLESLGLPEPWKRQRKRLVIVSAVCPGLQKHHGLGRMMFRLDMWSYSRK